jgi:hypothetical protein
MQSTLLSPPQVEQTISPSQAHSLHSIFPFELQFSQPILPSPLQVSHSDLQLLKAKIQISSMDKKKLFFILFKLFNLCCIFYK